MQKKKKAGAGHTDEIPVPDRDKVRNGRRNTCKIPSSGVMCLEVLGVHNPDAWGELKVVHGGTRLALS